MVTGASRGIGRAAALALAARARISSRSRAPRARSRNSTTRSARCGRARRAPATLVPCDLKDFAALDRLGEAIYRRWGRLDVSSATPACSARSRRCTTSTPSNGTRFSAVNLTANWRLIRALDPLLRASAAGRVVFLTSGAANRAKLRAYWGPYAVSKAGLDALARTYAAETQNTSRSR